VPVDSVRVEVHGPRDSDAVLWQWLTGVPELRGHIRQEPATVGPHELGAGTDLVVALVSSLVSGALVSALQVWLSDRASSRTSAQVTVTVTGQDGRSVSVTTSDIASGVQALHRLLALDTQAGPDAGPRPGPQDAPGERAGLDPCNGIAAPDDPDRSGPA
jgi:hypothetical protein